MLEKYRNQLDTIDNNIIKLIAKRKIIVEKIALYKKKHNVPVFHKKREEELLRAKSILAKNESLDPKIIKDIFNKLIKYSHIIQKRIITRPNIGRSKGSK
ncbi:chorismate mutase [Patescibacteria group bacterium]